MYSNSLARQFSSMFHAKCLLPRLDKLLLVRSWLNTSISVCTHNRFNKDLPKYLVKLQKGFVPIVSYPRCPKRSLNIVANSNRPPTLISKIQRRLKQLNSGWANNCLFLLLFSFLYLQNLEGLGSPAPLLPTPLHVLWTTQWTWH